MLQSIEDISPASLNHGPLFDHDYGLIFTRNLKNTVCVSVCVSGMACTLSVM